MTLTAAYDDGAVRVYHAEHAALAEHLRETGERPDAMIVDCPYGARTHAGHDGGSAQVNRKIIKANGVADTARVRRDLSYEAWGQREVHAFVSEWAPLVEGWMVSITDSDLAGIWRAAYEHQGRLGFHPLPCVERGMTVRFCGGGPSSWATYASVSRPRCAGWASWPTLDGAYVGPSEPKPWVGGKPVWLLCDLVRDYTRPGDTIVDCCCGGGTLGVAVRRIAHLGHRRAILADRDPAAVECTIKRLRGERTKPTRDDFPETDTQPSLFAREASE